MPRDYIVVNLGHPAVTLSAESINDAAEQWAELAQLLPGHDYTLDVTDGPQRYRIRVTMDQGHPVTGEPWRVFDAASLAKTTAGRPVHVIEQRGQLVLIADVAAVSRAFDLAREDASARLDVRIVPCSMLGVGDV